MNTVPVPPTPSIVSVDPGTAPPGSRPTRVPTLEQIRHAIQAMPATTDIERRNRALIAFTILTGARDGAIASFRLRHIDIAEGKIDQDAREVQTKFSKSFVTAFFPGGRRHSSGGG